MSEEEDEGSFMEEVFGCLARPRNAFKIIIDKPRLLRATVIILFIAIISAWASYNYAAKLPPSFIPGRREGTLFGPGGTLSPQQAQQISMFISATTGLIGVLIFWLVSSAIIHVLSNIAGGEGSFRKMLTLAGYSSIPLAIQQLLRLIDSFVASQEMVILITGQLEISDQPFLNATVNAAIDNFSIFRLWTLILLVIAIMEYRKLSKFRSILTVAVFYVMLIIISIFIPIR